MLDIFGFLQSVAAGVVYKWSPGCGSQRLLRYRSHPAGRGPNNSSLFPPLAAVVVASGLMDGSKTASTIANQEINATSKQHLCDMQFNVVAVALRS